DLAVSSLRQSGGGLLSHTKMTFSLVAVFSSVLFLTYGALIWMADSFPWASSIFGPFKTFAIPTLAFLMICLVRWAADGGWGLKVLTITMFAATVAVLIVTREGKIPIFMVLAGWLYWLRLKNVPFRNIFLSGLAVILLAISLIQISQIIRTPHVSMLANLTDDNPILRVLVRKAVWRQTETGYCLLNVIDAHGDTPLQASRQLFWLEGLVPRALWPDKPNMSKGDDYATDYCKFIKGRAPSPTGRHSASITLLGQPIIHGGMTGLILHGGLLLFGLGGLAWATRSPGSLSSLTVVALLPWWIDFDQDFVLYVANLVKFFLIMLPMIFIVAFLDNNRKDEIP
ncbi:MAG: hypothetical protein HON02_02370, partial [Rhodospirillaceae bacterium]|nr:hypothetical protein [Rhodospirillaceae bacterium]